MVKQYLALFARLLLVSTLFAVHGVSSAQTIEHSFDGDSGPSLAECEAGETLCGRQPEPNVAANGEQVVQVTWQNVRIYDYDGKLVQSKPLAELIRGAGLEPKPKGGKGPFEAHIVFN